MMLVLKLGTSFGVHYVEAWVVSILTAPENIFPKSGCNSVSIVRAGVGMQGSWRKEGKDIITWGKHASPFVVSH